MVKVIFFLRVYFFFLRPRSMMLLVTQVNSTWLWLCALKSPVPLGTPEEVVPGVK